MDESLIERAPELPDGGSGASCFDKCLDTQARESQVSCGESHETATISRVAKLYFGDNLGVLRDYVEDETVDLIYLDPPFNSKRSYNVLFADNDRRESPAQIEAFDDTWHWDDTAERALRELTGDRPSLAQIPTRLATLIPALVGFLGRNDVMAYLVMMALRLVELRRVLKQTGSLYLHCDPTASHYLKVLLDGIFGPECFRNEIIWRRTGAHGKVERYAPIHDTILFYTKSDAYTWNRPRRPYMRGHVEQYFVEDERGWRTNYYGNVLTGSGVRGGESGQTWRGFDPTSKGRHWAIPGKLLEDFDEDFSGLKQHEKLDRLLELGAITIEPGQAWPMYQRYIRPADGTPAPDIWAFQPYTEGTVFGGSDGIDADVRWLSPRDRERIGFPTQKPVGLLERIIRASSNAGDVVLDPFCGCGTSIEAAERLGRDWIGIDITHLAIKTIRERIQDQFGPLPYTVSGNPADADSARVLAEENPHHFQDWAVRFVEGRAVGGAKKSKKGKDRGIDGELFYRSGGDDVRHRVIISVKGGKTVNPAMVRELRGTTEREGSPIGVLITAASSTKEMRTEAARAGSVSVGGKLYPRIQILTVDDLFAARRVEHPGDNVTEGANPPPEQLLLFDQVKRGVRKAHPLALETTPKPARKGR